MVMERYRAEELALGFYGEGAGDQGEVAEVGCIEVGCDRTDRFLREFPHLEHNGEGSNLKDWEWRNSLPHHSRLSKPRVGCCLKRHWNLPNSGRCGSL